MAQITGPLNATQMAIYIGSTKITHGKNATLNINSETIDVSTKDSGGDKAILAGQRSWSVDFEGLFADDATYGMTELLIAQKAGTSVTVMFTTNVTGNKKWSGSAKITSLSMGGGVEAETTLSASFEGTGAITEAVVS